MRRATVGVAALGAIAGRLAAANAERAETLDAAATQVHQQSFEISIVWPPFTRGRTTR